LVKIGKIGKIEKINKKTKNKKRQQKNMFQLEGYEPCCRIPRDRKFRTLLGWSVALSVVAVILIVLSWTWVYVLWPNGFTATLSSQVIVDSPKSSGYSDWQSNYHKADIPPFYEYWIFFNLTNEEQVVNEGAQPIVEEIGMSLTKFLVSGFSSEKEKLMNEFFFFFF
jgi:CD36 family